MKILISGSTGLVGAYLVRHLNECGHDVTRLVRGRGPHREPQVTWDPEDMAIEGDALSGLDAVIHLAGESISGRWTPAKKYAIRSSRVEGTAFLCGTLAKLDAPPKVMVSASAVGFYGDRGDEELTEESPPGEGFLAEVCKDWEAASCVLANKGIRVAHARLGVVLSAIGGALPQMLLPFKLGLGGVIGSGNQYVSWIANADVAGALLHIVDHEDLSGPVNLVAPKAVTNRELTKTLAGVLSRPAILPLPSFGARLLMGEMAEELLLASAKVQPAKLQATGFQFRYPNLQQALENELRRP